MATFVVAIDGRAGSGKSTTAKAVAQLLNFFYLDTGAMYRAFTLKYLQSLKSGHDEIPKKIDPKLVKNLLKKTALDLRQGHKQNRVYLDGKDITRAIRLPKVSNFVSQISALSEVRRWMVKKQRALAKDKRVVCEGRDIGTVVFPDAEVKIYMTADLKVRAQRRQKELKEKKTMVKLNEVMDNIQFRDKYDSTRKHSPLKKAKDAIVVDTTNLTIEQEIDLVEKLIRERLS